MKHNPSPQGAHFYSESGLKLKKRARLEGMQPETGRKGHFNQPSNEQLGCVYTELQEPRIYNHSLCQGEVLALLLLLRKQTQKTEGQNRGASI